MFKTQEQSLPFDLPTLLVYYNKYVSISKRRDCDCQEKLKEKKAQYKLDTYALQIYPGHPIEKKIILDNTIKNLWHR